MNCSDKGVPSVRQGSWTLILAPAAAKARAGRDTPIQLYDLAEDLGQTRNSRDVHIWHVKDGKAAEFWDAPLDQAGDDAFLNS